MILTSPAPVLSSETEPDSQSQSVCLPCSWNPDRLASDNWFPTPFVVFSLPFLDPTPCPARPAKASLLQSQTQTVSVLPQSAYSREASSSDKESLPARKARTVDDDLVSEIESTVTLEVGKEREKEKKGKASDHDADLDLEVPLSTPANPPTTAQKRTEDYSVYKGRGRYGKNAA